MTAGDQFTVRIQTADERRRFYDGGTFEDIIDKGCKLLRVIEITDTEEILLFAQGHSFAPRWLKP